ncbi:MAG: histidinol dehydrogenase [Spirochaetia bacterium]|nr:histidinol dehydrogenase [Spirochaetia bacterium]
MAFLKIENLSDLKEEEKKFIIDRGSLSLDNVINETIIPIAKEVSKDSLKALKYYTQKWDNFVPEPLVLGKKELLASLDKIKLENPRHIESFEKAMNNLTVYHEKQKPAGYEIEVEKNLLGFKFEPFDSVALYVPGGKALYPSTVLMGIIPARIAGVKDITILSPPNKDTGSVPEIVKAVAAIAGADRILQAGGAQSILAAAHGLKELGIPEVDYIYGPGNIYVSAAKTYVFSKNLCGIDSFAGPSEVLIIADDSASPFYLAQDLLAQAEHDENACAILLCTDKKTAEKTIEEIELAIKKRPERQEITKEAMKRNGKIFIVNNLDEAVEFSNRYAPEHLEVQTKDDDNILKKINAAGSVFLGDYSPVAVGDYYSGTNHILPTAKACRFSSGVSVHSFLRRITWQKCSKEGLKKALEPVTIMSKIEGLYAEHGYSVEARFEKEK